MRHPLVTAGLTFLLVCCAPATIHAQESTPEHVLLDMQMWLLPGAGDGSCAWLESGTLTVQLQAVKPDQSGPAQPWPVEFSFAGYRGGDGPATIDTTLSSLAPTSTSVPLQGDRLYCFSVQNLVQVPADADMATRTQYWQPVNVHMAIQP
jgi:hypothetical protein